jgi:broad specificity phosphatase PhoE
MVMKNKFISIISISLLALVACSDSDGNSNPQTPNDNPASSSSVADVPALSSASDIPLLSSASDIPGLSSSTDPSCDNYAPSEILLDTVGVADIGDVWKNVKCDEKVVFVIRHAERESGVGKESPLTHNGEIQAMKVGPKLLGSAKFAYAHTDYVRTEQTCKFIALGRREDTLGLAHDTIRELTSGWYIKDSDLRDTYISTDTNSNAVVSFWAYDSLFADAYYDFATRNQEVINTFFVKDYALMDKAKVIISHDEFVVPLIAYVTDRQANFRKRKARWWINYLTGVAIIVNSENQVRYFAVKGLETATE